MPPVGALVAQLDEEFFDNVDVLLTAQVARMVGWQSAGRMCACAERCRRWEAHGTASWVASTTCTHEQVAVLGAYTEKRKVRGAAHR